MFVSFLHDAGKLITRGKITDKTHDEHLSLMAWAMPPLISNEIGGILNTKDIEAEKREKRLSQELGKEQAFETQTNKHISIFFRKIGDNLAAFERKLYKDNAKEDTRKIPLNAIFKHIRIEDRPAVEEDYVFRPMVLKPSNYKSIVEIKKDDYFADFEKLRYGFKKELSIINQKYENMTEKDINRYFNEIYYLFKKYFTLVPSASYMHMPLISLFDHNAMTCALATALFRQFEGNMNKEFIEKLAKIVSKKRSNVEKLKRNKNIEENDKLSENEEKLLERKDFLLIHGDLSGIQKFIFTIKTKNAVKTLRGRSAFLSFYNHLVATYIIKKLHLTPANIIFAGGGNFYILAYLKAVDTLEEIKREINKDLLKEFEGDLYLSITYKEISYKDFMENITQKWEELNKGDNQKSKKFKEFFSNEFFEPPVNPKRLVCSVCNKESDYCFVEEDEEKLQFREATRNDELEGKAIYCYNCTKFVELGKRLTNKSLKNMKELHLEEFPVIKNLGLSEEDFDYNFVFDKVIPPFMFFPINKNNLKSLNELGDFIGVLRMDIDNLGTIFRKGLKNNYLDNISSMALLSNLLSFFFGGVINEVVKEINKNEMKVYVVYSGGDDLFVLGDWEYIIEFVKKFYEAFRRFTCNNPSITISGGIKLIKPHYPIARAGEETEDLLDNAKKGEKNKVNLLNQTLKWGALDFEEDEREKDYGYYIKHLEFALNKERNDFLVAYNLYHLLVELINAKYKKESIHRGFLQRLIKSVRAMKRAIKDKDVPRIWRLKYYLRRNYEKDHKIIERIVNLIDKLVKEEKGFVKFNIIVFALAAKLAELKTRNKEVQK